jgi:hypothetical protein
MPAYAMHVMQFFDVGLAHILKGIIKQNLQPITRDLQINSRAFESDTAQIRWMFTTALVNPWYQKRNPDLDESIAERGVFCPVSVDYVLANKRIVDSPALNQIRLDRAHRDYFDISNQRLTSDDIYTIYETGQSLGDGNDAIRLVQFDDGSRKTRGPRESVPTLPGRGAGMAEEFR